MNKTKQKQLTHTENKLMVDRWERGENVMGLRSTALAGVAQWIECQPANQRAAGSIPSQGTCLGCGPGPQ